MGCKVLEEGRLLVSVRGSKQQHEPKPGRITARRRLWKRHNVTMRRQGIPHMMEVVTPMHVESFEALQLDASHGCLRLHRANVESPVDEEEARVHICVRGLHGSLALGAELARPPVSSQRPKRLAHRAIVSDA
jgi:hypothetical protein